MAGCNCQNILTTVDPDFESKIILFYLKIVLTYLFAYDSIRQWKFQVSQMEGKEMMRANRFAQVIAMDFAGTDYTDLSDSIREDFRVAISQAMWDGTSGDDSYWKWVRRTHTHAEYEALLDRHSEFERRQRARRDALCAKAISGGWLTEEEVREIAC